MKKPLDELRSLAHDRAVHNRLARTDVLVIDEISMMENHHLERLSEIMKETRYSQEPFGGVQVIVTGDFLQLPPVKPFLFCIACGHTTKVKSRNVYGCPKGCGTWFDHEKWAFQAQVWKQCDFAYVELRTVHRQCDETFVNLLQKCRVGVGLSLADRRLLLNHENDASNGVKLYPRNDDVAKHNKTEFAKIFAPRRRYLCLDDFQCMSEDPSTELLKNGRADRDHPDTLNALRDHRYARLVELKEDMPVILLQNLDIQAVLVNGTTGRIVGWEKYDHGKMPKIYEVVRYKEEEDPSVAVVSGEYGWLKQRNIQRFIDRAEIKEWPIVDFGSRGRTRTIYADCTVNEVGDEKPYSLLSRTQVPLIAGWAMSIHKAQGMTLDNVIVNLDRCWSQGQMYVALSRARSLGDLHVEALGSQRGCNPDVKRFLLENELVAPELLETKTERVIQKP